MTEEAYYRAKDIEATIKSNGTEIDKYRKVLEFLDGTLPTLKISSSYEVVFEIDEELRKELREHFKNRIANLNKSIEELENVFKKL